MPVKVGVDLLVKRRFLKSAQNGGQTFLEKLFTPDEVQSNTLEQLASIFCLKEALSKALELPTGFWLKINCLHKKNGKISCTIDPEISIKIEDIDTSISHDGGFIIAAAIVVVRS